MAAAEDDPIGLFHQFRRLGGVVTVQHGDGGRLDAGGVDAVAHAFFHRRREAFVIRGGAYEQHARKAVRAGNLGQCGLDLGQKTVVSGECGFPEAGGAAGKK